MRYYMNNVKYYLLKPLLFKKSNILDIACGNG